MPAKIRLSRHGKKASAFYHIVVTDSRAPRDGKYIEKIGTYNPNLNPALIDLDFEKTLSWLNKGAQPTDTAKTILSHKGVLYKKHLQTGVKKGAMSQEQADAKFESWLKEKEGKITDKKNKLLSAEKESAKKRFEEESKSREKKAKAILEKNTPPPAPEAAAPAEPAAAPEASNETPPAPAADAQPQA